MFRPCLLAILSTSILLGTGCGSSSNSSSANAVQAEADVASMLVGTWIYDPTHLEELVRAELVKAGIDLADIPKDDFAGILKTASDAIEISFEFKDDGTVDAATRVESTKESFTANWSVDGNTVTMSTQGSDDVVDGIYADGKLTISMAFGVEGVQSLRMIKSN